METYSFAQFGEARVGLYVEVRNGAEMQRGRGFGYIDARLITSRLHLQTAIYQALLAASQKKLRTRTVHSEVLWMLNPTNNIREGLRRYGVSAGTTSVVVVSMDGASEDELGAGITGTLVGLDSLVEVTDWDAVLKELKLDSAARADAIAVGTVAAKGVLT